MHPIYVLISVLILLETQGASLLTPSQHNVAELYAVIQQLNASLKHMELNCAQQNANIKHLELTVAQQKASMKHLQLTVAQQNASMKHLQLTVAQQYVSMKHLQLTVAEQNVSVKHLIAAQQNASIKQMELNMAQQSASMKHMQLTIAKQNASLAQFKVTVLRQNATIYNLVHQQGLTNVKAVGFYAKLTHDIFNLGDEQTIEFNNVVTNVGNAYDKRHGHFTVPINGMYLISASVMSLGNAHLYCTLMRNGAQVTIFYEGGTDSISDSQTIVLELLKGDMLWIRHWNGHANEKINSYNSYFSGFLIKPH